MSLPGSILDAQLEHLLEECRRRLTVADVVPCGIKLGGFQSFQRQ